MSKRFFSIVMCLLICLAIGTIGTALAEETEIREVKGETIYVQSRISEEQAEREYLNGLFGLPGTPVEELPRMRGTVSGSRFEEGSQEQKLYTALKNRIQQAAEGTLASTEFEISTDEIDAMVFTRGNVNLAEGESMFDANGNVSEAMNREIGNNVFQLVSRTISAVTFDCPYEAYWRDSGSGCYGASWWYTYSQSDESVTVVKIFIRVRVAEDYRVTSSDEYTIDTELIKSAHAAAANARNIVSQNAGKSDYGKLMTYKRKICELTDYNYDAANDQYLHDYGNPWQLVWVFDGNPNTKVVCEGYSKAFQYLCDQSTWNSNIEVISVAGLMWDKTETETSISWNPGAHMWNMVRMNGQNYLADVTNSDNESIGQFGGLFLDGYDRTGTASDGSTIYFYETEGKTTDEYYWLPGEAGYSYNGNTTATFEADRLGPASTAAARGSYVYIDKARVTIGENVTVTASLPGAGHIQMRRLKGAMNYNLTEIEEGDTGEWTVSFDEPGEYTLSVVGWSDERWNNPEIPNVSEFPDIFGNDSATLTVSYAEIPDYIIPGEDVTITLPEMEGAALYEISIEGPTNSVIYSVESPHHGDFVIPAMVFAEGGNGYMINITVFRENNDPEAEWPYQEIYWGSYSRDVEAYATGAQTLTITAGTFINDRLPIHLSVTDADQVIVQEKEINYWGYECWPTVCVTDNPGTTVNIDPLATQVHEIRAAVKKDGVWSAWSPVIEVTEPTGWTFGEVGTGIDREWVLHITGSGEMRDYSSPAKAPWYIQASRHENIRIVIDEGITRVGSNAFGNLSGTVRADFCGETMPTVAATAFSGTTARCRYYSEDTSWTDGTSGRTDAVWVYLPVYEEETPGRWPINYGYAGESTIPGWYLQDGNGGYPLTMAQAEELSYKTRVLDFDVLPRMADTALYDTGNVPWQAYFGPGCEGEYALNAQNGANTLERLDIGAPGLRLIIDRSTADGPLEFAEIKSGTVEITGDIETLGLRNSNGATVCSVKVTGDVDEMDFYNADTEYNAYSGDAQIIGTIGQGYEYGSGAMNIPGIGNSVPLGSFIAKQFSDLTRSAEDGLLIDDGVLTLGSGEYEPGGSTNIEDYWLEYEFVDDEMDEFDRTVLKLTPKGGGQGIDIDILKEKPTFSPADIIQGSDTDVFIGCWDPRTPKSITLGNGGEGQGINHLFTNSTCGTIHLNCPVNQLEVYQNNNRANTLELNINSRIENTATLSLRGNQNIVRLGDDGWLAGGVAYMKPLTSTRMLPAIQGRHDPLIGDGRLTVLSSKEGESLESILPGDSALATAAGMTAVMDISESTEPLNEGELDILAESLQIGEDEVAEVFSVTVTGYDAADNPTELDKLDGGTVRMAVKNTTGEEVYVARLHEENGEMTATAVSETTAADVVWFESDLFSKYMLVKPDNSIDPSTLLTLKLPDSLTRIEDYAFAGGAFQAVIIPDGCTYIGEHAFDGCDLLVYISYPASYLDGGIEIKESAFDGCGEITTEVR